MNQKAEFKRQIEVQTGVKVCHLRFERNNSTCYTIVCLWDKGTCTVYKTTVLAIKKPIYELYNIMKMVRRIKLTLEVLEG